MIKNILTAAVVAASIPATAQQAINSDGTGQVLLFPFYNADNNTNTYAHVVNNTSDTKAVKVRFLEYLSGAVALEWNLYLAPYDVYPMAITSDSRGGAAVLTNDESCTVPALGTSNGDYSGAITELSDGSKLRSQPFVPFLYADDKVDGIARTLMGSIEVIEMGVVDGLAVDVTKCDEVAELWDTGSWSGKVSAPTGGLSGNSFFIDVESAYSTSIPVTAIDGWSTTVKHGAPASMLPTLDQGVRTATVNGQLVDYTSKDNGGALATSALLAAHTVINEVTVESSIGASTDIVLSYPTKRYFVSGKTAQAPFTKVYDSTKDVSTSCETYRLSQYDREGFSNTGSNSFSSVTTNGVSGPVCDNLSVVSFGPSSALGVGKVSVPAAFNYNAGLARFVNDGELPESDNGLTITGLPVLGFASTKIANGVMSYGYGSSSRTFATMTITSGS